MTTNRFDPIAAARARQAAQNSNEPFRRKRFDPIASVRPENEVLRSINRLTRAAKKASRR